MAMRIPWPCRPDACSGAIPYADRIWLGNRPAVENTALGYCVLAQPGLIVPVRVGVPPATGAAAECATGPAGATGAIGEITAAPRTVTGRPRPATVSTLPFRPEPSF